MKTTPTSDTARVDDPRQAALLANPKALRHLTPFMERACTVGAAAKALGVSPHGMLYWVNKFLEHDLLMVDRTQSRRGKPIKWYRTPARRFFVPVQALPSATLEELLARDDEPWQKLLIRNAVHTGLDAFERLHTWGLNVYCAPDLRVEMTPGSEEGPTLQEQLLQPDAPALLLGWVPLQLDFEDAKQLQHELCDLLSHYQGKKGGQRYLTRVAMTPLLKE